MTSPLRRDGPSELFSEDTAEKLDLAVLRDLDTRRTEELGETLFRPDFLESIKHAALLDALIELVELLLGEPPPDRLVEDLREWTLERTLLGNEARFARNPRADRLSLRDAPTALRTVEGLLLAA